MEHLPFTIALQTLEETSQGDLKIIWFRKERSHISIPEYGHRLEPSVTRSKEKEKEKNAPKKPDSHEASNIY